MSTVVIIQFFSIKCRYFYLKKLAFVLFFFYPPNAIGNANLSEAVTSKFTNDIGKRKSILKNWSIALDEYDE